MTLDLEGPTAGAGPLLRWEVLYPRVRGSWPAILSRGTEKAYGLYDPTERALGEVAPTDDPVLRTLGRWLARGELVSYRVGRRAVVRTVAGTETAYAKILPPKRGERLAARHEQLWTRSAADRRFPGVPAVLDAGGEDALLLADTGGTSLHDHLVRGLPLGSQMLVDVARALVHFHGTTAGPFDVPTATGIGLDQWESFVGSQFPALRPRYEEALDAVGAAAPSTSAPADRLVHGDLHDKNVILTGRRVVLLDLDALRWGNPAEDVGNLAAHLVLRALQRGDPADAGCRRAARFTAAYRSAGGEAPPEAVIFAGAQSLFRLACLYCFRRRWQRIAPALLSEAVAWAALGRAREVSEVRTTEIGVLPPFDHLFGGLFGRAKRR
ncbi:MAG: aminoglycoside phosphotransferase family protein [Actinobacteria bacterium]|nr:aminoglycoside phosphotransferase family protein [Actinomycetota bacterium]